MSNFFIRFIMKNARKPEGFFGRVFAKSMGNGHDPMAKWALGSFRFNDGDRLLDVGCGGGRNIQHLFELYPGSAVDGVDYSPESVRVSRKLHAARLSDQCRIEEGNVMALPFTDETYGGVMGCETIYFWPDLAGGLKEIWRVLKPGGRIIRRAPTRSASRSWPRIAARRRSACHRRWSSSTTPSPTVIA